MSDEAKKATKWLAHIADDEREQTILEHLEGTAELCRKYADIFESGDAGYYLGKMHDIGKYTEKFQKRLQGSSVRVDHSTAGAYETDEYVSRALAFCIAGHHGGLPDEGSSGDVGKPTLSSRLNNVKKLEDYSAWKTEVESPDVSFPAWCMDETLGIIDLFFYIRMLYSCLVDADFIDTETFMLGHKADRGCYDSIKTLNTYLDNYTAGWFPPKGKLNEKRCEILTHCIEHGKEDHQGLFSLTVPTGGGKTVSSLAFALRHAKANHLKRIIYVVPYTSIIEQTADKFREILGETNVLEHHSGVIYETDQNGEINKQNKQLLLATENWDCAVIVTTAVQFFESLYANKSSKCRKLHNIAKSVIIFDEAQMIPMPYLKPCVSSIAQLVKHYHVTAVLCTATQPALDSIFKEYLPEINIREICPKELYLDPVFRRVRIENIGTIQWDELTDKMNQEKQVLCIVNSRKNAQNLYEGLEKEGRFHLSTLMTPYDRKMKLQEIKKRLEDGLPCRVVSTSLIEAGVDVDFPVVFREMSGLDSILQAAGRCNREGKGHSRKECIVTVFKIAEEPIPLLFKTAAKVAEQTFAKYENVFTQEAISFYFKKLRHYKGEERQDQKNIMWIIEKEPFSFAKVASRFRLIDNNTATIYIRNEVYGKNENIEKKEIRDKIKKCEEIWKRYNDGERSRALFREMGQFSVSVYEQHMKALYAAGDIEKLDDESYILVNPNLYNQNTGLSLEADFGKALWG